MLHFALALAVQSAAAPSTMADPKAPYWQQHVDYRIVASLDEPSGVLSGTEAVRYQNHSPDTLTTFSLHLYLNAFRPGSRWADADSVEGRRRFNDLEDPDFAFNHVRDVRIMGQPVTAMYPFAPDSTIVRFALPRPLLPGEAMQVTMSWDARPSTTPRRQGRRGRAFDFAQWYPRVVAYDRYGWAEHPLYPAGEFYGDFGTFLVDLDVPQDQVIGATGVPLCGDPGWAGAARDQRAVEYRRDYYGTTVQGISSGAVCPADRAIASGRKRVVWYAADVHHFAMSMNPEYRYEGGHWGNVAVHVLYQPGDEEEWGGGVAVERTETALEWLDGLFGPFAWPQLTNVHRIEGGGTEFPMMIMDGGASQGLIVHELGHNYVMGILANNEWREGFLDEGFTSFQTSWFFEEHGGNDAYRFLEPVVLGWDLDGISEPVSLVSEDYRDFVTYNWMIYTRGQVFYSELRYIVGDDAMRKILRTYYDRWKLKHVDEEAFKAVAEEVSGMDLSTFFAQWLHGTVLYDYGVGRLERNRLPDGRWFSRVEVLRHEEGRIPVDVAVIAGDDTTVTRIDGLARSRWVEVITPRRPDEVRLDPDERTHDWNYLNNERKFGKVLGIFPQPVTGPNPHFYLDTYLSEQRRRDRESNGIAPALWYNAAGGLTVGIRGRSNYFGRYNDNVLFLSQATGAGIDDGPTPFDFFFRLGNPVMLRSHRTKAILEGFRIEGRFGGRLGLTTSHREHPFFGPATETGAWLEWVEPDDFRFLDPGYYEDVGTVELRREHTVTDRRGDWRLSLTGTSALGLAYNRDGLVQAGRSIDPFYARVAAEGTAKRSLGGGWSLGLRAFAGAATGDNDPAPKQRQIYVQGADPLRQLGNPFLRSQGALLNGDDFYYQQPGGAGLRGYDPRLSVPGIVALNAEVEKRLLSRPRAKLFREVAVAAFGDLAQEFGSIVIPALNDRLGFAMDAGVGLRIRHRIGQTSFVTRADFPLYVSKPAVAQDRNPGADEFGFRWVFGFQEAF